MPLVLQLNPRTSCLRYLFFQKATFLISDKILFADNIGICLNNGSFLQSACASSLVLIYVSTIP